MELELATVSEMIYTTCSNCCFATFDENNEQIGCAADQLEKSRNKELVDDLSINKSVYLLDGFLCMYKRAEEWAKNVKDPLEKVNKEIDDFRHIYGVCMIMQKPTTPEEFKDSLDALNAQTLLPAQVSFLICDSDYPKMVWMNKLLKDTAKFKWNILKTVNREVLESIDEAVKGFKTTYYSLLNVGDTPESDYFEKIDCKVRKEEFRFFVLEGRQGVGPYSYTMVMNFVHNKFGGNKPAMTNDVYGNPKRVDFIVDKLKFILKDHQKEQYVKTHP